MVDLSIIIVSYNCREYLRLSLRSIFDNAPQMRYEIIVIDNNSTDDTDNLFELRNPNISYIKNSHNNGFASANNIAIQQAQGKYLLLLNPDTVVSPRLIDILYNYLEEHINVGVVGPKVLNSDGSVQLTGMKYPSLGDLVIETLFLDRVFPRSKMFGRQKFTYLPYDKPFEVDYVQGSCLMTRANILKDIGLLDESYFMYFEETDLCYRIKKAGFKIVYNPHASMIHHGGGEFGHYTERRLLNYHKSLLRYFHKHHTPQTILYLKGIILIRSTIRILLWLLLLFIYIKKRKQILSILTGYVKSYSLLLMV